MHVCPVHCGKTTDWIWMRFGMVGRMGPGMRHVVGFEDRSTGRGNFGANVVHPVVTNGELAASHPLPKSLWDSCSVYFMLNN